MGTNLKELEEDVEAEHDDDERRQCKRRYTAHEHQAGEKLKEAAHSCAQIAAQLTVNVCSVLGQAVDDPK